MKKLEVFLLGEKIPDGVFRLKTLQTHTGVSPDILANYTSVLVKVG